VQRFQVCRAEISTAAACRCFAAERRCWPAIFLLRSDAAELIAMHCCVLRFTFVAAVFLVLLLCAPSLSAPSAAQCDHAYRSALQHGDASITSVLEECALHYRSQQLLRVLALAHARSPSSAAASKLQVLLGLMPSDAVLLHTAAAVYMRVGHRLWAALALTRAVMLAQGADSVVADKFAGDAARQWDALQRDDAARRQVSEISGCCENQQPSRLCAKHFVESDKFLGM
jgi:hypothetical protein